MSKADKPLVWLHDEIKTPPLFSGSESRGGRAVAAPAVRREYRASAFTADASLGKACHELRIQDSGRTWRIVYCIDAEAIVILDVFAKSSPQTPKSAVDVCKARLKLYVST